MKNIWCVSMIWGCDYIDGLHDETQFLIVDAESEEEARQKSQKILVSYGIPKRNIVNLFEIDL